MAVAQVQMLPGFEQKTQEIGDVETAFLKQIETLEEMGVMSAQHAGIRALVLRAARAVDQISPSDAASGRSSLLKALDDVSQRLPAPKSTEQSALDRLEALFCVDTADAPSPYDNPHDHYTSAP